MTLITFCIGLLALLAAAASVLAIRRLTRGETAAGLGRGQHVLVWAITVGSAAVFAYRVYAKGWNPVSSHLDGLMLLATLLGITLLFLQRRPRMEPIGAFTLPLLTLVLVWALCPESKQAWAFSESEAARAWTRMHLAFVYVGTLASAVAATAGAMYLYVEHRLHQKRRLGSIGRLASLEKLETMIIRQATLGFTLLSLGLLTGLVVITSHRSELVPGWWHTPKIVLATVAWLVYAILMNLRSATAFRGARAAWLSIAGLVLLLSTYAVVSALPGPLRTPDSSISAVHAEAP
jgi:ABC-type uncharacterized transport system permease subunit